MLALPSVLEACGSSGTGSGGSAGGTKTIRLWTWYTQQQQQWPQLIAEFEKANPGIKVENRLFGISDYLPALQSAVAAGTPPDVFGPHVHAVQYGTSGITLDLASALGKSFTDQFFPSTSTAFQSGGKQYAVAWMAQTFGVFYNPQIFDQAGVSVPETWDDLIQVADQIKSKTGLIPSALVNSPNNNGVDFLSPLITQASGDPRLLVDLDQHTKSGASWNTRPVVEGLQLLSRLVKAGVFEPGVNGTDQSQAERLFYSGKAAMFYSGSWVPQDLRQSAPADFLKTYRVMPTPAWSRGGRHWCANQAGAALAVSAKSAHQDAALAFLKFLYEPNRYARVMNESNSMPATTGAARQVADPVLKTMTSWLQQGDGSPHIFFGNGSETAVENAAQAVIQGQASPQQAAQQIESDVQQARQR